MIFEIHITGDESIHEKAKSLGVKTIEILNLTPDGGVFSIHHMTSERRKFETFEECKKWTLQVKEELGGIRAKIECPPLPDYMDDAEYIECHFKNDQFVFPTSVNAKRPEDYLATKRENRKYNFTVFARFFNNECFEVELCLYDDNQELDRDWMELWNAQNAIKN